MRAALFFGVLAVSALGLVLAAPSLPVFPASWYSDESALLVSPNGNQQANGTSSYSQGAEGNITSWFGSGTQFVADFDQQTVFYLDYYKQCQFTCPMDGTDTPCSSQLCADSLCSYDMLNRAEFVDQETVNGDFVNHWYYPDPMGPIVMASHDFYALTEGATPVQVHASYTPFGQWASNVTLNYVNFQAGSPPAANFNFTGAQYCQQGDDSQCSSLRKFTSGHLAKLHLYKFFTIEEITKKNL